VADQISVDFGTGVDEVASQIMAQVYKILDRHDRNEEDVPNAIIFQATPPQFITAIGELMSGAVYGFDNYRRQYGDRFPGIGFVVSEPGERPPTQTIEQRFSTVEDAISTKELIKRVNPRTKVFVEEAMVEVQVEPPMRFKFKEIAWLFTPAIAPDVKTDGDNS
jgi:hypothetical protein